MERVGESKRERERVWCCVGRQGFDSVGRGMCVRARERARKSERKRERVCVCVCVAPFEGKDSTVLALTPYSPQVSIVDYRSLL